MSVFLIEINQFCVLLGEKATLKTEPEKNVF